MIEPAPVRILQIGIARQTGIDAVIMEMLPNGRSPPGLVPAKLGFAPSSRTGCMQDLFNARVNIVPRKAAESRGILFSYTNYH